MRADVALRARAVAEHREGVRLGVSTRLPPLDQPAMRRAVALAIDRTTLSDAGVLAADARPSTALGAVATDRLPSPIEHFLHDHHHQQRAVR